MGLACRALADRGDLPQLAWMYDHAGPDRSAAWRTWARRDTSIVYGRGATRLQVEPSIYPLCKSCRSMRPFGRRHARSGSVAGPARGGGGGDRQQPCQAQTWAVKQGARSRQPQAIDQAPAAVWPRHPPPSSKAPTPTPTDTHARKVVASHPVQSALFDYFPSLWHLAAACGGVL